MLNPLLPAPPDSGDRVAIADWAELLIVLNGVRHASKMDLEAMVRTTGSGQGESVIWAEFLAREVERRKRLGQGGYPFWVENGGVSVQEGQNVATYVLLLLLSSGQRLRSKAQTQEAESLFDHLVLDALKSLLGPASQGLRFGTPADPGRPTGFLDALEWLSEKIGLALGAGTHRRPKRNDGGADVIAWRKFRDQRSGFLTILGQCTVQTDWRPKAKDIVADLWSGWIDFGKAPTTCLAIPFVVPKSYEKWDEVRRTVVLVLDRLRLIELLDDKRPSRASEIEQWTKRELKSLAACG